MQAQRSARQSVKSEPGKMTKFACIFFIAAVAAVPATAQSRLSFALGGSDSRSSGAFTMIWHSAPHPAGWSYAGGLYATDRGAGWVGAGLSYTLRSGSSGLFARGSFMPGLYTSGSDIDLGGTIEFATTVEVGTRLRNDAELSLMLSHRSNAGIYTRNPGVNTLSLSYSIPLN